VQVSYRRCLYAGPPQIPSPDPLPRGRRRTQRAPVTTFPDAPRIDPRRDVGNGRRNNPNRHLIDMTDADLRGLLIDCLTLWRIDGRVTAGEVGMEVNTPEGLVTVRAAPADMHPVRWLLQTPPRRDAGRPPRAAPSIGALLSALRNAIGAERGVSLRIGAGELIP